MKDRLFYKLWLFTLAIKVVLATLLPIGADEAYYWVWSKNLQLSYYDHPPLVSWLFYLGQLFENLGNAVRLPAVIFGHCAFLIWYFILREHFTQKQWNAWFLMAIVSPILGIGGIVVTPDLPLLTMWSLSLLVYLKLLKTPKKSWYFLFGIALGVGFVAKYHIVIFVLASLLHLTIEKKWQQIRWNWLPYTIVGGLIACSPVLLWNAQNDWASFRFQLNHGLEGGGWKITWTTGYIVGQVLAVFPLIFWYALRSKINANTRFLIYFAWTPIAFFLLTSFKAKVELNWPTMGYPALFALAILNAPNLKILARTALGVWVAIYALVVVQMQLGIFKNAPRKLRETSQYEPFIPLVSRYSPAYGNTYQMSSYLWYRTKQPFFKLRDMSRRDFYDELSGSLPNANVIYVFRHFEDNIPPNILEVYNWKKIESVDQEFEVDMLTKKSPEE